MNHHGWRCGSNHAYLNLKSTPERSRTMGDKGGKKNKDKSQKQSNEKHEQKKNSKIEKQQKGQTVLELPRKKS